MTPSRCLFAGFLACLALAVAAAEQPEVVAEDAPAVARLLAASDPANIAWGAYHAGRLRLAEMVPELLARIEPRQETLGYWPVQAAVIAALADLRPAVEIGVPERIRLAGLADAAILLAAADPARHQAWLCGRVLAKEAYRHEWLAAANLLAARRNAEAILAIFVGLEPTLTIRVVMEEVRFGEGHFRTICGDGRSRRFPGFPPVVSWRLTEHAGTEPVCVGPIPIWGQRSEQTKELVGTGSVTSELDRGEYRTRLLLSLLGAGAVEPAPVHDADDIAVWHGREALLASVAELRAGRQRAWTALTAALVEARLLPAGTQPPVVRLLELQDRRTGQDLEPLPEPAAVAPPIPDQP